MAGTRVALYVLVSCWAANLACAQSGSAVAVPEASVPETSVQGASAEAARESYASWIAEYRQGPLRGAPGDNHKIELAMSLLADDVPDGAVGEGGELLQSMVTTFALSTEGTLSMVRYTSMAVQGGGPEKIPKEDFKRLKELMRDLPDDHAWLPPKRRRLVVQLDSGRGMVARVYDRANLPEAVIEMADLLGADTWPLYDFPRFEPEALWKDSLNPAPDSWQMALVGEKRVLAVSSDGRLRAVEVNPGQWFDTTVRVEKLHQPREAPQGHDPGTTLRIEDVRSGAFLHEFRQPPIGNRREFVYAAQFTPDGRRLLLQSSIPDLQVYDTATWQRVDGMQGVPAGAVAYYPAPDWKRGIGVLPTGEINLIESETGRTIVQIDPGYELQAAVYSPDGSKVAIVTVSQNWSVEFPCHLRIWDVATGRMLRELRPLEGTPRDGFGAPVWWPDGRYLLALTREGRFGGSIIGIWNSESGRYRGGLTGCISPSDSNVAVVLEKGKLYMDCRDEVLRWDGERAVERTAEIEESLIH